MAVAATTAAVAGSAGVEWGVERVTQVGCVTHAMSMVTVSKTPGVAAPTSGERRRRCHVRDRMREP
ncbi:hypothetical protein GCM10010319_44940 [Streptomyces blastmyceticus]|uniref:Secreted protein n=1 Tax=Streptomyces blastmyceticus TaxID=68180 RepID=A0ABN0XEM6_9ACTN